ncbi:MAG TPA: DUF2726 domain-containing protein [Methanosarcina sp.]|nr:DUF2726 domain-containing protein [Methanosarcina sp.]
MILKKLISVLKTWLVEHGNWPFYAKKLLSSPEQALYFKLCRVFPEYIIFSQVSLSRILGVKKGYNNYSWNNRISRMSADFVICEKDFSVLAVIELDDKSHLMQSRIKADRKKDKVITDAGLKIVRWQLNKMPDEAEMKSSVVNITQSTPRL